MALGGAAILWAQRGQGHPGTPHCKRTVSRWCHKCPGSALSAPGAGIRRTGKTGAGKGEENKGLWTKKERSSGEEKAKRTQREEEEKQSSSSILRYLEEPKAPEPSLPQEHLGRIVARSGNASIEFQPLWPLSAHSTCARYMPVSPPLSHFHLSLQRPGFALENSQAAFMHPRGQLQTW